MATTRVERGSARNPIGRHSRPAVKVRRRCCDGVGATEKSCNTLWPSCGMRDVRSTAYHSPRRTPSRSSCRSPQRPEPKGARGAVQMMPLPSLMPPQAARPSGDSSSAIQTPTRVPASSHFPFVTYPSCAEEPCLVWDPARVSRRHPSPAGLRAALRAADGGGCVRAP